ERAQHFSPWRVRVVVRVAALHACRHQLPNAGVAIFRARVVRAVFEQAVQGLAAVLDQLVQHIFGISVVHEAEHERAERYNAAADEIVSSMTEHLYSNELGRFIRSVEVGNDGSLHSDSAVDASLFATFYFGCYEPDDEKIVGTMQSIEDLLAAGGGIARFENDGYIRTSDKFPGNSWFICTLWVADYYIARAKEKKDMARALEILEWVAASALPSGVLAEQLNPETGEHVSVSPLTWSHSTFIATVGNYLHQEKQLVDRRRR
ncbi:MAG: glycoside hydrolase family 15 protein, partial [Acidobacteriota bacterium]